MAPILPRYRPELRVQEDRSVDKAVEEAEDTPVPGEQKAGGDRWRLRGIPVIGRGVGGTSPQTDPLAEVLRKERRAKAS
jgi:hypothetical protein